MKNAMTFLGAVKHSTMTFLGTVMLSSVLPLSATLAGASADGVAVKAIGNKILEIQVTGQGALNLKKVIGGRSLQAKEEDSGVVKSIDCATDAVCTIEAIGEVLSNKDAIERAKLLEDEKLRKNFLATGASLITIPFMGFDTYGGLNSETLDKTLFKLLATSTVNKKETRDGQRTGTSETFISMRLDKNVGLYCNSEIRKSEKTENYSCGIIGLIK